MTLAPASTRTVLVTVADVLADDQLEQAWRLYEAAFRDLNAMTVQRHLMYRPEFDDVASDRNVDKHLAHVDGQLVGLATYTNHLDAMPLISPAYFARRWPKHYAERRIWYCGFVAVDASARGTAVFGAMVEAMYRVAADQGGIIGLDFCRHNAETRRMPRVVRLMLNLLSGDVRAECIDEQQFWLYEFPNGAR